MATTHNSDRGPERTAAEAYAAHREAIEASLVRLRKVLKVYDVWQRESPRNWGLVGDVGSMSVGLSGLLEGCEAVETWVKEKGRRKGGAR